MRLVRAVEQQEVEGDEPEFAVLARLNANSVLRASGQDCDGGLKGVVRDRIAGVDDGLRTDEFAVEDGADQVLEAGGEVRQVGRELVQPEGDLGGVPAGDANAVQGLTLSMSTGALRIAALTGAVVIPCLIRSARSSP